jgi:hypothetical protein
MGDGVVLNRKCRNSRHRRDARKPETQGFSPALPNPR